MTVQQNKDKTYWFHDEETEEDFFVVACSFSAAHSIAKREFGDDVRFIETVTEEFAEQMGWDTY